jgi:hypothetical protein
MQQNYSVTKGAGLGQNVGPGYPPNASWSNPNNITADDGSSASIGFFEGGQDGDALVASQFGFDLPDFAVIDGIAVTVDGGNAGCFGSIALSAGGSKDVGALNQTYGDNTDLWGETAIAVNDVNNSAFGVQVDLQDVSGGDGIANIDYLEITIFYHVDTDTAVADVPTRFAYKVYSRDGNYLGELPNVSSKFSFAQDINSAGSSIVITCGEFVKNEVTAEPLLTEDGEVITTESDLPILVTSTELLVTYGASPDEAIFKNSNRIKVWMYNRYYPNGKLMFSGQVNKVNFKYGGGDASVKLTVYSDGLDLNNFITRGYPFSYTTDVSQDVSDTDTTITQDGGKGAGWLRCGQSWIAGASNIGLLRLRLVGSATVTVSIYDGPNGNFLGSTTKPVAVGSYTNVDFEFAQLIDLTPGEEYFFAVSVAPGQSMRVKYNTTSVYANGVRYTSTYSGGSGGGSYTETTGDLHFITKSGTPTTTATYSSDDPVTEMASDILLDYNARGGYITERDFDATGLSITYTFVVATIYDALKKILELCPTGYYSYIDLGTAEIDIKQVSDTPDFTVVRGRHINELDLGLSIEQVKNYLLLSGGETGGDNLYRDYKDSESASNYGIRTATKSDNRITIDATADAVGDTFIDENSEEIQETSLLVKDEHIDISLLTPGKTIGFKNFGNFIDGMVLQIVRREPNFSDGIASLSLGRLPIRMSDEIQKINQALINEQTINNPSAPS